MNQETAETPSVLERRIDMTVPVANIDQEVEQRLRKLTRTVKMPGFRPGKVPFKLVAQQYGAEARNEVVRGAVEKAFGEKVREQNLRVAGYPRIEPKTAADASELAFSATFEIYPEITLADLAEREIEKPELVVGDAELAKTIEVLRAQRVRYLPADRAAQDGDRIAFDFVGRKDGVPFPGGEGKDHSIVLGQGKMLADFEAQLVGVRAGETKTFDLTFPAEYQAKELAGQTVQFDVDVKQVEEPQLPEIDADFAKALGIADGDVEKMRAEVRANLEREVKKRLQARIKNQVMDLLLAAHPIEVPKALVEVEAHQMAEATMRDLQARGVATSQVPLNPSWFVDQAKRRVTLGLIVAELVKQKELAAQAPQVRAAVDEFAQSYEDPAEVVRWYYSEPQRLAQVESLVVENNVVDWVLAHAKVKAKAIDFDELMGNRQ